MRYLRAFNVSDGSIGAERAPQEPEDFYATPEELGALFGCAPSEADVRFAMAIVNTHCNRPSLWPCEIESGIINIPPDRQETRLPITPVVRIIEAAGRYARGRRDRIGYNNVLYNYGATLLAMQGAVPQWQPIDPSLISLEPASGILYLPTGTFLYGYTSFKCRAIVGFVEMPYRVKAALVEIINTVKNKGVSDRMRYGAGRVSRQYASDSFITPMTEKFLQPFVVQDYQ